MSVQQTLLSFSVLGFPVRVRATFLLLAVLVPMILPVDAPLAILVAIPMVLGSIVVHELGHALTARQFGMRTGDIVLHGIGGHVTMRGHTTPARQVAISLAGPGAGLLLGATVWGLSTLVAPLLTVDWVVQLLIATRDADWLDMAYDWAGIALGCSLALLARALARRRPARAVAA